jgi:natural product precursor
MKKKLNQKLTLNKKTVANLSKVEMDALNGGAGFPVTFMCTVTAIWPDECRFTLFECPDPDNPMDFTDNC